MKCCHTKILVEYQVMVRLLFVYCSDYWLSGNTMLLKYLVIKLNLFGYKVELLRLSWSSPLVFAEDFETLMVKLLKFLNIENYIWVIMVKLNYVYYEIGLLLLLNLKYENY